MSPWAAELLWTRVLRHMQLSIPGRAHLGRLWRLGLPGVAGGKRVECRGRWIATRRENRISLVVSAVRPDDERWSADDPA